jgi:uncharacterized membrane protein
MKVREFWICSLLVIIVVAISLTWAVRVGNPYLAVIILILAAGTLYLCRKRVHEVIEDERDTRINERAAMKALEVFVPGGIIAGVVLYTVSTPAADFTQAGLTLGIAVTGLPLLYAVFQTRYARIRGNPDEK